MRVGFDMATKQPKKLSGVSSEAAKRSTGLNWDEWLSVLDDAGAKNWAHKEIVAYLKENHDLSPWWQQMVTVSYEKAKGRRVVGQTADAGFQVGVQKTVPVSIDEAWTLLISPKGITCWLGNIGRSILTEGKSYETDTGTNGEVRVVKPGNRVRLTWQKSGMKRPVTLQIALVERGPGKTSVRVHLEKLPSQKAREEMKGHWKNALDDLARLAAS